MASSPSSKMDVRSISSLAEVLVESNVGSEGVPCRS
jgi:hypothetical protein